MLKEREQKILDYMREEIRKKGYPPTVREICSALNIKSTSTAHKDISNLVKAGYIKKDPSKPRALMLVEADTSGQTTYETGNDDGVSHTEVIDIPVVGRIAAGTPILAEQNIEDSFPVPARFVGNNPNFMLTVKPSYVDIDLPYIQNAVAGPAIITSLNALMPQVQGYAAVQNSDGWTITFQTDAMTEYTYTFTLTIYSLTQEGVLTVATDQFNTVTYQGTVKALF